MDKVHEEVLNITKHKGNANQNHNNIPPHTCQNGCYQKHMTNDYCHYLLFNKMIFLILINSDKDVEKKKPWCTAGMNVNCYSQYENNTGIPQKVKTDNHAPFSPIITCCLSSGYCQFLLNFSVSGYICFLVCFLFRYHLQVVGGKWTQLYLNNNKK